MAPTPLLYAASETEIFGFLEDPMSVYGFFEQAAPTRLDAAWPGLHQLFVNIGAGRTPFDFLVAGGYPIGEGAFGHGPARAFNSSEVQLIREAVNAMSAAVLTARLHPSQHGAMLDAILRCRAVLFDFLDEAVRGARGMLVVHT
jgi:hypothetical protein